MYLDHELIARSEHPALTVTQTALEQLELVHSFIFSRVGNRADAEELTQQVALKALPRLREGSAGASVRSYLYATARSVVAAFWARRYRVPESELSDNLADEGRGRGPEPSTQASAWLEQTLATLPSDYRQVLELRFLRECSLREVAREMGKTVGAVKLMQLRALRAAARAMPTGSANPESRSRPARRPPANARGFASGPQPEGRVS
ncbi:MAG TPA: sigma-70 family RNA polymerase sigma factor [Candidatus Dormibacteraeota bacterium]|nr:sigma-70 family RNA polymerase sigma factor [Candidatus Dormibacteraeota bacterium]